MICQLYNYIDINNEKNYEFSGSGMIYESLCASILGSITRKNKKVDVVIAVTKLGNTIVLDRLSGEPIYDFHLKGSKSNIPGEKTNHYQPNSIPEPFAKNTFNLDEVTNINKESKEYILNKTKDYKYGFLNMTLGKKYSI